MMKSNVASLLLAVAVLAASGCSLHPPYGPFNDNTSAVPPLGAITHQNTLPPAAMLMHPGPGVDGPGPGIMMGEPIMPLVPQVSQVAFSSPAGMAVQWDVGVPGGFDSEPLIVPGRFNFPQGAIYRLKLTNIPGHPGAELYPTLEIAPPTPRSEAYLAHNSIPVQFTDEDFGQVLSGNFVTKVIYLPDPEFQEVALAGVETLVSTRLDPTMDPIVEADRRGAILGIIRVGNKDLEVPQAEVVGGGAGRSGAPMPMVCAPGGGAGIPPGFVAGVTAPQYGMPMSGTPIGLPGPPHIPLGIPAGLQKHVIKNHTKMHIPGPVKKFRIDVKQEPGMSYPKPVSKVHIVERSHVPPVLFKQPHSDRHEHMIDGHEGCEHGDEAGGY